MCSTSWTISQRSNINAIEKTKQRTKASYTNDERKRAVELANKIGLKSASFYLDIPQTTLYGWINAPAKDAPKRSQSVGELKKSIDDLKDAIETLAEAFAKDAEGRKPRSVARVESVKPSLFCAIESEEPDE